MRGVTMVSIPVTDQDRAAAFSTEHLGFRVVRDNPMGPDTRWVQLGAGEASTNVTLTTWFERLVPGTLEGLVIDVEDPAAVTRSSSPRASCSDLGDEPWGRYFMCRDPDGNGLVVAKVASDANG